MDDLLDFLTFVGCIIGGALALFVTLAWLVVYPISSYSCRTTADQMGLPWYYSLSTGCMVQYRGQWVPLDGFRAVQ